MTQHSEKLEQYDNTHARPWLVPLLAQLGFHQHDSQSMVRECMTAWDGPSDVIVRWFASGCFILSFDNTNGHQRAYRGLVHGPDHLLHLIQDTGWLVDAPELEQVLKTRGDEEAKILTELAQQLGKPHLLT